MGLLFKKHKEVGKVVLVPLDQIRPNPNQPRKHFDSIAISELSESISANGLLQPIIVRKIDETNYELVAGERRTMAFRNLNKDSIPAIIENYTTSQSAVMALVENLQRKDLNFFEEAAGLQLLLFELELTQEQLSKQIGKSQSALANKLRLLAYTFDDQCKILNASLTERHARALLKVKDTKQRELCLDYVINQKLNVEMTEKYIESFLEMNNVPSKTRMFVIKDIRIFLNTINKAVSIMKISGIPVDLNRSEDDEYLEFLIKIPKSSAYKNSMKNETCSV